MRLLEAAELAALPLTEGYLTEHEEVLRQRESGKMNHNGWYGYVYPKSLGAHDSPKLGVPRLCARLRASADSQGGVYLDNVDVNGILISDDAPSLSVLAVLLNSRLLDWLFRRGSVPFRGDFFSANKQFIAPLPIREPIAGDGERLGSLGKDLHAAMDAINVERKGFLDWLEAFGGARIAALAGVRALRGYDSRSVDEVLAILASNRGRLEEDPRSRTFREQVSKELEESLDRLQPLKRSLAKNERLADRLVYDLYEMTENDRRLIDEEYE